MSQALAFVHLGLPLDLPIHDGSILGQVDVSEVLRWFHIKQRRIEVKIDQFLDHFLLCSTDVDVYQGFLIRQHVLAVGVLVLRIQRQLFIEHFEVEWNLIRRQTRLLQILLYFVQTDHVEPRHLCLYAMNRIEIVLVIKQFVHELIDLLARYFEKVGTELRCVALVHRRYLRQFGTQINNDPIVLQFGIQMQACLLHETDAVAAKLFKAILRQESPYL